MASVSERFIEIVSDAVLVPSSPFRIGMNHWDVQLVVPAGSALAGMEGSNDKLNWNEMLDAFGNAITTLGSVMRVGINRPKWLRFIVELDASQPRTFTAIIEHSNKPSS